MSDAPMPPVPSYRRDYGRRREDSGASAIAAVLRAEGRTAGNAHRRRDEDARGPDWMITLDGEPTALVVTRLLPAAHVQKAHSVVAHVEAGLRDVLAPDIAGVGGQVLLTLAYSARGAAGRRRGRLAADTRTLASEVRQTLNRLVGRQEPVAIQSPIQWVVRAEVTLVPGPHDGFYIIQAPDEAYQQDLDHVVSEWIDSHGDRHLGHAPRAILAVDAMFDAADALRRAFDRSPVPVPWWRVYQVLGSNATLVHEGRSRAPSGGVDARVGSATWVAHPGQRVSRRS